MLPTTPCQDMNPVRRRSPPPVTDGTPIYPSLFIYCEYQTKYEIHLETTPEAILLLLSHSRSCFLLLLHNLFQFSISASSWCMEANKIYCNEKQRTARKVCKKRTSAKKVIYVFLSHSKRILRKRRPSNVLQLPVCLWLVVNYFAQAWDSILAVVVVTVSLVGE